LISSVAVCIPLFNRTRGSENGVGDGPLRSAEISRLASPYADDDAGAFLFMAPETAVGEKKRQR
jgi:hypothetical protein